MGPTSSLHTTGGLELLGAVRARPIAKLLCAITFSGAVLQWLAFIAQSRSGHDNWNYLSFGGVLALGSLWGLWRLIGGNDARGSIIISCAFCCFMLSASALGSKAGLRAPELIFAPVVLMFTTWLLGRAAGLSVLGLFSAGLALLAFAFPRATWMPDQGIPLWLLWMAVQIALLASFAVALMVLQKFGEILDREAQGREMLGLREQEASAAREQLYDLNKKLRAILDASGYAVMAWDPEGRISSFNRGAERLLGYSEQEVQGRAPDFLHLPEELSAFARELSVELARPVGATAGAFLAKAKKQDMQEREWTYIRKDRRQVRVLLAVSALRSESGRMDGYVAVAADISEQARAREALEGMNERLEARLSERAQELEKAMRQLMQSEKLAALGSMVAGVSHEMSTPIGNALLTATSLAASVREVKSASQAQSLRRSELNRWVAELSEGMQIIESALHHASSIMGAFKGVAVDQSSEQWREYDLLEVLRAHGQLFGARLKQRQVSLIWDAPETLRMEGYPGKLGQVVGVLLSNALEHAFDGSRAGALRIEVTQQGERVRLAIQDDGAGIDPAVAHRIFEPFFTTRMGRGGSGLGLSIARGLVEGPLGGRMELRVMQASGCRFELDLPLSAPKLERLEPKA